MAEICPMCGFEAIKIRKHNSKDAYGKERHRKEYIHGTGSHTVEVKDE